MPAGETLRAFLMEGSDCAMPEDIPNVEIEILREDNERLLSVVNEFSTRFAALNFKSY
jgi:hypothetical protein